MRVAPPTDMSAGTDYVREKARDGYIPVMCTREQAVAINREVTSDIYMLSTAKDVQEEDHELRLHNTLSHKYLDKKAAEMDGPQTEVMQTDILPYICDAPDENLVAILMMMHNSGLGLTRSGYDFLEDKGALPSSRHKPPAPEQKAAPKKAVKKPSVKAKAPAKAQKPPEKGPPRPARRAAAAIEEEAIIPGDTGALGAD